GSAFDVMVIAMDEDGNVALGYNGTVHFTSTDANSSVVLPADYTFTPDENGVHVFANGATLVTAGIQTISATDSLNSVTGVSDTIAVSPLAADHLGISLPDHVSAGSAFSLTVTAQDPFNNADPGYTGTVHFTKTDSASGTAVPANYTFVSGDHGVHVFTNGA